MSKQQPPKILFLTAFAPEGEDKGSRLRARNILLQLSRHADVRLILAGAYEKYSRSTTSVPVLPQPLEIFDFLPWNITGWADRLRYEFGSTYLNTHGFKATAANRDHLLKLMNENDLVWIHGLRVANGFNIWKWPKTILDIDDIPSDVCKTEMVHGGPKAKLHAFRKYCMWKRHEARLFERFEAMAVCSEADRAHFGNSENVFVIPNGADVPTEALARKPSIPARIGFIGGLDYPPNANGLRWFLRKVWPVILKSAPDTILRIAGKLSENAEWISFRNVEGLGWIADADAEMATWTMTVVPIFEGGGTRIKISTAFSRKCPVVSTPLGAYGYAVSNDNELLLANEAPDFSAACLRLLRDPQLSDRLAETAWTKFLARWTWEANAPRLESAIRFVLENNQRTRNR